MRPKHVTYTIAAFDDDGVCTAQTLAGAGALTLDGALVSSGVATFAIPRHVLITAVADEHLINFVITGSDRYDRALTETIAGPTAGATVTTTSNFKTITSVTVSAALTGNVKVGNANALETPWIPLDVPNHVWDAGWYVSSGGNMFVTLETTIGDVFNVFEDDLPIDGALGFAVGMPTATAVRLKITSHVSGNVTLDIIHRGDW